ncbi:hypothetical protein ACLOJK_002166 [Asimina triloba]
MGQTVLIGAGAYRSRRILNSSHGGRSGLADQAELLASYSFVEDAGSGISDSECVVDDRSGAADRGCRRRFVDVAGVVEEGGPCGLLEWRLRHLFRNRELLKLLKLNLLRLLHLLHFLRKRVNRQRIDLHLEALWELLRKRVDRQIIDLHPEALWELVINLFRHVQ